MMYNTHYYNTPDWYRRCDRVKARAGRLCEFCRSRPVANVHHRSYDHFGREPLSDLMAVCRACHRWIHKLRRGTHLIVADGSLADRGDSGMGDGPLWRDYLASTRPRRMVEAGQ